MINVIVPTYQRPRLLKRALRSLLEQTLKKKYFEVVVINDGSHSEEYEKVAKFYEGYMNIKYVKLENNHGVAFARDMGIKSCDRPLICYLDDDDEYEIKFLETMFRFYNETWETKEGRLVYCDCLLREEGKKKGVFGEEFDRKKLFASHYISLISVMHSRSLYLDVNGFDEELFILEDWDLMRRMAEKTNFYYLKETLAIFNRDPKKILVDADNERIHKSIERIREKIEKGNEAK